MRTLSISTKLGTAWPLELVIAQEGPGETQPDGVAPADSHLFAPAEPDTGGFSVIPGENGLLLREFVPVVLFVMSVVLTTGAAQATSGFQDAELIGTIRVPCIPTGWDVGQELIETINMLANVRRTSFVITPENLLGDGEAELGDKM